MTAMKSVNPATEETFGSYELMSARELEQSLLNAEDAFLTWRTTSIQERLDHLTAVANLLRENKAKYAKIISQEMGKPIRQAEAEVEKCALVSDYYIEFGPQFLAEKVLDTGRIKSKVAYEPLGCLLAIMPWNFPFWQVFRFAVPNVLAGNVVLLKHASNVPECGLKIARIFQQAGLPDGVFQTLLIDTLQVESVLRDSRVKGVTLTGSNRAGTQVGRLAGELVKKCVLELGGSDAYVILKDADLDQAAEICAASRLLNSGQSCIAAKRFIVVEEVKQQFQTKLVEHMAKAKLGDPMDPEVQVGPLARADLQEELARQVKESLKMGARCLLGGKILDGQGYFYAPTVLTDVTPGMPAFDEELFGPVAAVISAVDEISAVRLANQSRFGLGAAVFTRDIVRGEFIATHELEAGSCAVNTMVKSDPRLPFGGIKESGHGRELADIGMREFVNIKSVVINE